MQNSSKRKAARPDAKALIHAEDTGLPERNVPICLAGKLQADYELAERELAEAEEAPADSLAGNGSTVIARRIEELREQMKAKTIDFRLRALPRKKWRKLKAEHPPRKDEEGAVHAEDKWTGVNTETFFPLAIRACLIDPDLDESDWEVLDAKLTFNQYDTLSAAVWVLNATEVDVPFSLAASKMLRSASA